MSKFWVIFKREYAQVVKKKSFVVGIFLTPALMAGFLILPTMFVNTKSSEAEPLAVIDRTGMGIGQRFAESLQQYRLEDTSRAYYDVKGIFEIDVADSARFIAVEDSLRALIANEELKYTLVVGPDAYLCDSCMYMITNSDKFRTMKRFEDRLSNILSSVRLEVSDVNLGVDSVLSLTRQVELPTRDAKGESLPFVVKYLGSLLFVMLMFGMIMAYGQMVMRSVIEEKSSRIMEVMISSVTPFQLLLGKILGLGAATFTQAAVWIIIGSGIYSMKATLNIDPSVDRLVFNPAIAVFFVLFLVTGYLLYSALFAFIGSIVNSEKEAQNFVFPITMSMVLPVMIAMYVVQEPNSPVSIALSMFPFFTPTMMTMRVVFMAPTLQSYSLFSGILAQATIGFVIVTLSVIGMIWLTSKVFRIGILMYGKRPTLPEIMRWVKY
ncbi:MAG: ABC transporter permease [Candidatus Zixiibacteriota bacterium]